MTSRTTIRHRSWRDVVGLCARPHHLRTTVLVALLVGTVLFAINQLDVVIHGRADGLTIVKILLTYCVPFVVANFGIVHATPFDDRRDDPDETPGRGMDPPCATD